MDNLNETKNADSTPPMMPGDDFGGNNQNDANAEAQYGDSGVTLLQSTYEGCDMGLKALRAIVKNCEDTEFDSLLSKHIDSYAKLNREIASAICEKGADPKKAPAAVKAMAKARVAFKKVVSPDVVSSYAKMAYKGANMGILDINHLLNDDSAIYGDKERSLACRMLAIHSQLQDEVIRFL